jgi:uncharacterized membrane protein YphA (DoxX/SURF4 family)
MNSRIIALLLLRLGLGGVFLVFGIDKFFHPAMWSAYIPQWFPQVSYFIYIIGIVEAIIGICVLIGFKTRIVSGVAALMLLGIIASLGYSEITVRDAGLLMTAIAIVLLGAGEFSLDAQILKTRETVPE